MHISLPFIVINWLHTLCPKSYLKYKWGEGGGYSRSRVSTLFLSPYLWYKGYGSSYHIVSWSKLTWFCQVTRYTCQIPLLLIKLLFRYCIKLSWSNLSYCIMVHGVIYMNLSSSLRQMSNSTLCWSNYCFELHRYLYQTLLIKPSYCIMVHGVTHMNLSSYSRHMSNSTLCW